MWSKLKASLSWSKNISMVSPNSLCCVSAFNCCSAPVLFHSTTCNFDCSSGKLKKSCATSNALPTNLSSISSPLRLAFAANLLKAFFTKSICANGDGMAVRGTADSPPLGSLIMFISSAQYWFVKGIHPSPVVLLLYDNILDIMLLIFHV